MPVLSARLHVFNICWEWSPKILPPSINIYCFSGFPTPSGKYLCSITHSLKYVNVQDTESIKRVIPREGRLRQEETRAWFPTTIFTAGWWSVHHPYCSFLFSFHKLCRTRSSYKFYQHISHLLLSFSSNLITSSLCCSKGLDFFITIFSNSGHFINVWLLWQINKFYPPIIQQGTFLTE